MTILFDKIPNDPFLAQERFREFYQSLINDQRKNKNIAQIAELYLALFQRIHGDHELVLRESRPPLWEKPTIMYGSFMCSHDCHALVLRVETLLLDKTSYFVSEMDKLHFLLVRQEVIPAKVKCPSYCGLVWITKEEEKSLKKTYFSVKPVLEPVNSSIIDECDILIRELRSVLNLN